MGVAEDEMVRWHQLLNGLDFEQTPGDSEGQGNLTCCNPWGCKVRHNLMIEKQQLITMLLTPQFNTTAV